MLLRWFGMFRVWGFGVICFVGCLASWFMYVELLFVLLVMLELTVYGIGRCLLAHFDFGNSMMLLSF